MKDLEVTFDIEEGKDLDCVFKIDALSTSYNDLSDKPQINGITLEGNKTGAELGFASEQDIIDLQEKVIENEKKFDDYRVASEQDIIDDDIKASVLYETNERRNADSYLQEQITENKSDISNVKQTINNLSDEVKQETEKVDTLETELANEIINRQNADSYLQNQITENKDNINKVERELSYEADEREKADEALQEQITANASNFNNYRTASEQDVIDNGIKTDINNVQASVSDIQALIPNQASKDNQLADKNFVNSSLATDTANFLGTYDTLEELEAVPNPTNNDYGFVKSVDDVGNTVYSRYKYNATNAEWLFEYALNNSSFTAEQWTAINSGITGELVGQITTNKNDIATKQDIITDLTTIRDGASKGNTAVQPNQLHDGKLTIKANGQEVATFTANQATDVEADITIATPTNVTWGNITGTLSNQTDLQNALNAKQDKVSAGDNITINNNIISVSNTLSNQVATNTEKIKEIELFKFPNAVIIGEPVINNEQVSSFSTANYMQFPFIVDVKNKPFSIDFGFTTGDDITTQQNIIDSNFGMALAIKYGKALMAISSNGTSWDIGAIEGEQEIQANSTYLARITWDGTVYKGYLSTDGGVTYQEDMSLTSSLAPYPRTIYIGGGTAELLGHTVNPFLGIIDMNKAYLTVQGLVIWQGMDDAGLATRADVSLSNLNAQGLEVIRKNSSAPTNYVTTDTNQNITGAKNFINSATSTTPDAHTGMSITLKNSQAELGADSTNSDGTVNFKYQGVRFVDKNNEEVASLYSAPDGVGGSFTRLNASAKVDGEYVDGFIELEVDANGKTHFYIPEVDEDSTVNGTQAATVDYVKSHSGGGLEIGTIVTMPFGIDESENKYRYLNGQVLIQDQFSAFTTKVKSWQTTRPNLFTTETNWQAEKTASKLGQCGKFVVDDTAGTIRLPLVININGLTDLANCGVVKDESLPNISGSFKTSKTRSYTVSDVDGAFELKTAAGADNVAGSASVVDVVAQVEFNASLSSSTYQDDAPVQQEAIQYPYVIVVNTGVEEAERPINNYQVNNVYSYGMSTYYKGIMNNNSWLRSAGQWNSGAVYTGIYNWIVEQANKLVYDSSKFTITGTPTITDSGVASNFSTSNYVETTTINYGSAGLESIAFDITFTPNETQTNTTIFDSSAGWKLVYVDDNNLQATSNDGYTYTVETTESMVGKACKANIYSNLMGQGLKVTVGTTEYTGDEQSEMVSLMGANTLRVGIDINNSDSSVFKGSIDLTSIKVTANDTTKFSVDIIRQAVDGFKLSTEEYTDYDWVLNTEDETFRLPLLDGSENIIDYNNAQILTDYGVTYTATKRGVLIFSCGSNSISGLKLTINGVSFTIGQGYAGVDYFHLTGNWFEVNKGDAYRIDRLDNAATNIMLFAPYISDNNLYYYIGDVLQNTDLINIARLQEDFSGLKEVASVIEETYVNGTSGYRIWSKDSTGYRYCEQWGFVAYRAAGYTQITLMKSYKDVYYCLTGGCHTPDTSYPNNGFSVSFKDKTTTSFYTALNEDASINSGAWTWQASGYISD